MIAFTGTMSLNLLNMMMGASSFMAFAFVLMCMLILRRARLPTSVTIFVWNLIGLQFVAICVMMLSRYIAADKNAAASNFCRLTVLFDHGCLYITSIVFMFLVLDRLAAFLHDRYSWKHQTKYNKELSYYAVVFSYIMGLVAAIPTASVAIPSGRSGFGCQIPAGYTAVEVALKVVFLFLAPVVTVVALIIQISYHRNRDFMWRYASRALVFYTVVFFLLFPINYVKAVRSGLFSVNNTAVITPYPEYVDYILFCCEVLADFRLTVFSMFILALCDMDPLRRVEQAIDQSAVQLQVPESLLKKWLHLMDKLNAMVTWRFTKRDDTAHLTTHEEPMATSDSSAVEVTVTPSCSAVFSSGSSPA
ncbi:Ba107 [Baboon cytomegalovirus]|nr:Ba107 [Baboon cytomegalovirus]